MRPRVAIVVLLNAGVVVEGVEGDLGAAGDHRGLELAAGAAPAAADLAVEDDLDAGLGRLPLSPMVAVEAQLGVIGEIGAELDKERAELLIDAGTGRTPARCLQSAGPFRRPPARTGRASFLASRLSSDLFHRRGSWSPAALTEDI